MAARYFCDWCGREVTNHLADSYGVRIEAPSTNRHIWRRSSFTFCTVQCMRNKMASFEDDGSISPGENR